MISYRYYENVFDYFLGINPGDFHLKFIRQILRELIQQYLEDFFNELMKRFLMKLPKEYLNKVRNPDSQFINIYISENFLEELPLKFPVEFLNKLQHQHLKKLQEMFL